ncbi:cupin domain-containing protein [Deinococcus taeanensis]|uniref:cupin domain-containing protein n=1 Tax=Deinococcus taeanensis TaxID=2737050 RepID=UPI001CDD840D|nr:cupin domain-containing protein [Deinococcus taeanensis]UBV42995.1 cupin domain-containing protein [Deinococcus taeanensis]
MPNSHWPVRVYRAALSGQAPAAVEAHLAGHGWSAAWRNGIYPYHHYHSTAHEVLVIACGQATLTLGGEGGPTVSVAEGDVLVLPAGTGHRRDAASADLLIIGAYAQGRSWDICRPEQTDPAEAHGRIVQVPDPLRDPVTGEPWSAGP